MLQVEKSNHPNMLEQINLSIEKTDDGDVIMSKQNKKSTLTLIMMLVHEKVYISRKLIGLLKPFSQREPAEKRSCCHKHKVFII